MYLEQKDYAQINFFNQKLKRYMSGSSSSTAGRTGHIAANIPQVPSACKTAPVWTSCSPSSGGWVWCRSTGGFYLPDLDYKTRKVLVPGYRQLSDRTATTTNPDGSASGFRKKYKPPKNLPGRRWSHGCTWCICFHQRGPNKQRNLYHPHTELPNLRCHVNYSFVTNPEPPIEVWFQHQQH